MPDLPSQPGGDTTPTRGQRSKPNGERDIPWRLILMGAVTLYAVLFATLNSDRVRVHFVFFTTTTSLIVVMLIGILLGVVGGYLFRELRARRRRQVAPSRAGR